MRTERTRETRVGGRRAAGAPAPGPDRLWYRDAVVYQLSVRAFRDSDGDGVGDLRGLTERLDYLQDLGVTALWLQPFQPSPLRDDGYDVADHTGVHPALGTMGDFRHFLREAHARGLRVLTELVLGHTSDQHPWFQRARRAPPGSRERDYYLWSSDPSRFEGARVLFRDFESSNWAWDPVAGAYYWHRFYSHEPSLNLDSPDVRRALREALDFWLEAGVDGVRLDAVSFLFAREGTACENLPETHELVRELRRHVERRFPGRVLMTEASLWPEEAISYFGSGDECQLVAYTPLTPRLFTAVHMEDRYPLAEILEETPPVPDGGQWALYLRNHDELTLDAVTEEERDLMFRAYAADPQARLHLGIRRRLAPLLGGDRRRIELMTGMLLSLPGTPVLYYGDELGMGDNVYLGDRSGVRTPMQWSAGANAGFSDASPQRVQPPPVADAGYSYVAVNVEAQRENLASLLWWTRRILGLRRRLPALGRGSLALLYPANRKVLAFVRTLGDERVLVVANLSRHAQHVELDLAPWRGARPVEALGQTEFPPVGEGPYPLALGPHDFYWLVLEPAGAPPGKEEPARLSVAGSWEGVFRGRARAALETALPGFLLARRWFAGKARRIRSTEVLDAVAVPAGPQSPRIALVRVSFAQGEPETYALPLAFAAGEKAGEVRASSPGAVVAALEAGGVGGVLYAAERDPGFAQALLDAIRRGRRFRGAEGEILAWPTRTFRRVAVAEGEGLAPSLLSAEQSNTSIRFGTRFILKLFRRAEAAPNPDVEVGAFLTDRAGFSHTPPAYGGLEYRPARGEPLALGILQGFVTSEGDAWRFTLDAVDRFYERLAASGEVRAAAPLPAGALLDLAERDAPEGARRAVGPYLDAAGLLGRRTGELHLALASHPEDEAFAPEPFTRADQRSLYQSLRDLAEGVFQLLRQRLSSLPPEVRPQAEAVLSRKAEIAAGFRWLVERPLTALRTRTHGDYHLGQVLWTGKDFVIIDFEGEPSRPVATRRSKRSPLRDVAGMLRSFHYAAWQGLSSQADRGAVRPEHAAAAESWAHAWHRWVSGAYLRAYLEAVRGAPFLPHGREELADLLGLHLMEKAVYELSYELNNRPAWVRLPLEGVAGLLASR